MYRCTCVHLSSIWYWKWYSVMCTGAWFHTGCRIGYYHCEDSSRLRVFSSVGLVSCLVSMRRKRRLCSKHKKILTSATTRKGYAQYLICWSVRISVVTLLSRVLLWKRKRQELKKTKQRSTKNFKMTMLVSLSFSLLTLTFVVTM